MSPVRFLVAPQKILIPNGVGIFVFRRNTKVSEYIITGVPKEPDTNWNFALKMAINMPESLIVSKQTSGR